MIYIISGCLLCRISIILATSVWLTRTQTNSISTRIYARVQINCVFVFFNPVSLEACAEISTADIYLLYGSRWKSVPRRRRNAKSVIHSTSCAPEEFIKEKAKGKGDREGKKRHTYLVYFCTIYPATVGYSSALFFFSLFLPLPLSLSLSLLSEICELFPSFWSHRWLSAKSRLASFFLFPSD